MSIVFSTIFIVIFSLKYEWRILTPVSIIFLTTSVLFINKTISKNNSHALIQIQRKSVISIHVLLFFVVYIEIWSNYINFDSWTFKTILSWEICISTMYCLTALLSMYYRNRKDMTFKTQILYVLILFLPNPNVYNLTLLNIIGRVNAFYITYYLNLYGGILLNVNTEIDTLVSISMWVLFVNNYVVLFSFPYWFLLLYRVYNTIDLLQCDENETFLLKKQKSTPAVPEEEEEVVTLDIKKIEKKQPLQSVSPKPETKSVEEKDVLFECQNEYDVSRLISLSKSIRVLGKKC